MKEGIETIEKTSNAATFCLFALIRPETEVSSRVRLHIPDGHRWPFTW